MDKIKDVVGQLMGKLAQQEPAEDASVERLLNNLLTEKEIKHVKFVGIKEGNVLVLVDSSAWLYQLNIRKNKILSQLQEDKPEIKSIRFKIGKVT